MRTIRASGAAILFSWGRHLKDEQKTETIETTAKTEEKKAPIPLTGKAKVFKALKWTTGILSTLLVMGLAVTAGVYLRNPTIRSMIVYMITHRGPHGGINPNPLAYYQWSNHGPIEKQHTMNVMLLGCDHDYGGKRLKTGETIPTIIKNTPGRSDSIMLAHFNFDEKSINILSIPRDSFVHFPDFEGKHYPGKHKINAAHQYGGPEFSRQTMKEIFGIDCDYYVDLNFESFQEIVDSIGGVDVNIHTRLKYDDNWGNLHVNLMPGLQHLDGYKAMGYVRIRHSDNDLMRAQRQHEFIEALRGKVSSPASFLLLPNMVSKVTENLKSDLSNEQLLSLANYARSLPKENIHLETLPVREAGNLVYLNIVKDKSVIRRLFYDGNPKITLNINGSESDDSDPGVRHRIRRHSTDTNSDVPRKRHEATGASDSTNKSSSSNSPSDGGSGKTTIDKGTTSDTGADNTGSGKQDNLPDKSNKTDSPHTDGPSEKSKSKSDKSKPVGEGASSKFTGSPVAG